VQLVNEVQQVLQVGQYVIRNENGGGLGMPNGFWDRPA